MADIFISYSREDIQWASNLSQTIQAYGWSSWWDPDIPPGEEYDQVIENELTAAKCVIVGWSNNSIKSRWVKDEAQEAHDQGKIIPVLVDGVKPPLGFRHFQNTDLTSWGGTVNSPQIEALVKYLEKSLGPAPKQNVQKEEYQRTLDFFTKLFDYDTGHISTVVRLTRDKKTNDIISSYLIRANRHACRLYNINSDSYEMTAHELLTILEPFVDAKDMKELIDDQIRVTKDLIHGRVCEASVPIRINNKHPYNEIRNQLFMPIITAFSGKFSVNKHIEELIAISYINLSRLCKNI